MDSAICHLSIVAVRAEPSHKLEQVTQILFGETFDILQSKGGWCLVKLHYDGYEGWIDGKQFARVPQAFIEKSTGNTSVSVELAQSAVSSDHHVPILLGSSLPYYDGMSLKIGKEKFVFNGQAVVPGQNGKQTVLEKVVNKLLNAPYQWGGRSPFGMDCSGFTQVVFKTLGVKLPRDSHQQAEVGKRIDFVPEAKAGDLAFFENKDGKIAHVGIIMNGKIAHAYGQVRLDKLDHQGIYNDQLKEYTHLLRVIKRVF